jgi:hypothetical protein
MSKKLEADYGSLLLNICEKLTCINKKTILLKMFKVCYLSFRTSFELVRTSYKLPSLAVVAILATT